MKKLSFPHTLVMLTLLVFTHLSCTKDSDLLAEYVIEESIAIEQQNTNSESNDSEDDSSTDTSQNDNSNSDPTSFNDVNMGELKAFPGAEGFGKYSVGGRGGKVIEVTNLNDSGAGSLRAAIADSGSRTVVFKVAGYITLESSLNINNDYITIAGQTAPGDGITLRITNTKDISALRINASNVIIRGIRIRPGKTSDMSVNGDAMTLSGGNNIIFDHCSFSWSTDEIINPYGSSNMTFQNCIFSEALMYASHKYSTDPSSSGYYNPHSMGMLIGNSSNAITVYNSIFAHNNQRNPLIGGSSNAGQNFELVNNIYYNWGAFGTVLSSGSNLKINLINNYYIPGSDTKANRYSILVGNNAQLFVKGNINNNRTSSSQSEWDAIGISNAPYTNKASLNNRIEIPFDYPLKDTGVISKIELIDHVTNSAGPFNKDNADLRIINDLLNRTGSLINDPSDVGGYPFLNPGSAYIDQDKDGMEDTWELANGFDPNNADDGKGDTDADGYTNLETFLHSLTQK